MTLVVTTATSRGITVVGDKAETVHLGELKQVEPVRQKVFYSDPANVSFAIWGDATWPAELGNYSDWFRQTIVEPLSARLPLGELGDLICEKVNPILHQLGGDFEQLRRGVHVAGYVDGIPHIYHCHTGDRRIAQHELKCHHDYPQVHVGDLTTYRKRLDNGLPAQLRNGRYDLFSAVSESIDSLLLFCVERGIQIPAPTIDAQVAFDASLVRFASGLMEAAGYAPTVSLEVDVVAFNEKGPCKLRDPNKVVGRVMPSLFAPHVFSGDTQVTFTSSAIPLTHSLSKLSRLGDDRE